MYEEKRRLEEAANRCVAEETAERTRKEAEKIAKESARDGSRTYSEAVKRKKHGDSIFGSDGNIDYTSAPQVKAPVGMKAVVTIKNNCWDVSLVNKDE